MKNLEEFLKEGKKITIKRKYTENYPAATVGKTASVRNEVLKAVKDGVITEEEFTKILSKLSTSPKRWRSSNSKYFFVSEDGVQLSKWGLRILSELDVPALKAFPICEATVTMDAMDPKSNILKKLLKKHKVTMKVLDPSGPSGWPEVKMTGKRKDLEAVLASEDGWDDPDLAEYIEESVVTESKMEKEFAAIAKQVKKHNLLMKISNDLFPEIAKEQKDGVFVNFYPLSQEQIDQVYDELVKRLKLEESTITDAVIAEAKNDGNLDTIADYVKQVLDDGKSFMDIGKKLKGAYKYDFSTGMMPMYVIPVSGNKIVIINKKYVEDGQADRIVGDIAIGLMENIKTENTNMENTFSIHESFTSFTGASGFLNEKLGSQILASILMGNKEGKHGKENLKRLAGGFYQMAEVALDKIQDEDFILDNNPQKAFKNHGGSSNIIFFISDNEKENPYLPHDAGSYHSLRNIPGGGILLAAMGGDREFYTNDWSRYSKNRSWKKDGRKGSGDQVGVNKKYRGWGASGLSNGKRIAEVSDRVIIVNLDLIRQKYSTKQLRDARQSAKAGATAFTSDKEFKAGNKSRYYQILATKAAAMPIDKMVEAAIDELGAQIKAGLNSGNKTKYGEIKIGENSKGNEVKLRDASNHMSNILDDYSRYCDYVRQGEESQERYGQSESYYERESKNYAKTIKDRIAKIKGFDYAW